MAFVPTPHTPQSPRNLNVSPRARDLARSLEKSLEEFRERNPSVTDGEIRQALMLLSERRSAGGGRVALVMAAALGVAVLAGVMVVMQGASTGDELMAFLPWVVMAVVVTVLVARLVGRGSREG